MAQESPQRGLTVWPCSATPNGRSRSRGAAALHRAAFCSRAEKQSRGWAKFLPPQIWPWEALQRVLGFGGTFPTEQHKDRETAHRRHLARLWGITGRPPLRNRGKCISRIVEHCHKVWRVDGKQAPPLRGSAAGTSTKYTLWRLSSWGSADSLSGSVQGTSVLPTPFRHLRLAGRCYL